PGHCIQRDSATHIKEQEGLLPTFKCTLYVMHRGPSGWETPKVVSPVTTQDQADWRMDPSAGGLTAVSSRVSPNGGFLAYMSNSPLTGYNNVDASSGKPDEEVFLYDNGTQGVSCVSCNPTGAQPHGVKSQEQSGEGSGLVIDRILAWNKQWLA